MSAAAIFLIFVLLLMGLLAATLWAFAPIVGRGLRRIRRFGSTGMALGQSILTASFDVGFELDTSPLVGRVSPLMFRAPGEGDYAALRDLFSDPVIVSLNRWTPRQQRSWLQSFDDSDKMNLRRSQWIVAEERTSGKVVGLATLGPAPAWQEGVSVGLLMRQGYRQHGYGVQLAAATVEFIRRSFDGDIWAAIYPDNEAVQALLHRLGYQPLPGFHPSNEFVPRQQILFRCSLEDGLPNPDVWN